MKTEDDLLEAIADLMMHQFRTQLMGNLKTEPAKLLPDEEYAEGFEQMKKEAAAFLQYLMTHDLGNLPGELRGENN